jgi:hypothetical protein
LLKLPAALALLALLLPASALGGPARLESLGNEGLFLEDSSNVFTNPALLAFYGNRAWFSLGVSGDTSEGVRLDPHGGASITIRDLVTVGAVLNRSPTLYGFSDALYPTMFKYLPLGPGGPIAGPDGPTETTAPLRFPVDIFVAVGDVYAPVRFGFNVYYAGGSTDEHILTVYDEEQDLENDSRIGRRTHLINTTLGLSMGNPADRTRGEFWFRVGNMTAWYDEVTQRQISANDYEPITDRILSMDRDLRVGAGFRLHLGDSLSGLVVTPGLKYDVALGSFRFDDNRVSPDNDAEKALRETTSHDIKAGVGLAFRRDDLLVLGSVGLFARNTTTTDFTPEPDSDVRSVTTSIWDIGVPQLTFGAEYRLLPWLIVRGSIKSVFGFGRRSTNYDERIGSENLDPLDYYGLESTLVSESLDPGATVTAGGGIGIEVKRFGFDAIVGGIFLGEPGPLLFSRFDLRFIFD